MKKKWVLIISSIVFVAPALASDKYAHCMDNNTTEICQAFIAGLESGILEGRKSDKTIFVENSVDKDSLLKRALEQRAGGRNNSLITTEKE